VIATFLCGVLYGWLVDRALVTAHNRRVLAETLPPSECDEWTEDDYNAPLRAQWWSGWPEEEPNGTISLDGSKLQVFVNGIPYEEWLRAAQTQGSNVG